MKENIENIENIKNLSNYGKHLTADDWKEFEDFIDSNNDYLDRTLQRLKSEFEHYQREVKEEEICFLDDVRVRFLYIADEILGNLLKDVEDEFVEEVGQPLQQKLENFSEDVREQLNKELRKHQKREIQILENGIKGAYDFFEHCIKEYLENKLYKHINE